MPEIDYWNPDLEAYWGEAAEALVRFYGKTWEEAIKLANEMRERLGCNKPDFNAEESMIFHELPYYWIQNIGGTPIKEGMEAYYAEKYWGPPQVE